MRIWHGFLKKIEKGENPISLHPNVNFMNIRRTSEKITILHCSYSIL